MAENTISYVHDLQIEFGGFPRSGHGYMFRCLMDRYATLYTGNPYRHHFSVHRTFLRSDSTSPFIVPVRDPRDALISDTVRGINLLEKKKLNSNASISYDEYLYEVDTRLDLMTTLWEVVSSSDRFFIAPFTEITLNKDEVLRRLELKHPELKIEPLGLNRGSKEILEAVAESDRKTLADANREIGHVPRPTSPYRSKAIEIVSDSTFNKRLDYLYELEQDLTKKYEDIDR